MKYTYFRFINFPICALLFVASISIASAQQTCESRNNEKEKTSETYRLTSPSATRQRYITISCTGEEDQIRTALRDLKTKKVLQSFTEMQTQTYLEASTPDLDGDGYADLVLVTSWGNPNMNFKAWRYDPIRDRLNLALDGGGTELVRAKDGRIVSIGKGGADSWGYTLYKWNKGKLVPEYSIDETIGDDECVYHNAMEGAAERPITSPQVLKELKSYCGIGGAGLIERGQNLLSPTTLR